MANIDELANDSDTSVLDVPSSLVRTVPAANNIDPNISPLLFSDDEPVSERAGTGAYLQADIMDPISPPLFGDASVPERAGTVGSQAEHGIRGALLDATARDQEWLEMSHDDFLHLRSSVRADHTGDRLQVLVDTEYDTWHAKTFHNKRERGERSKKAQARGKPKAKPRSTADGDAEGEPVAMAKRYRRPSAVKRREQYARVQSQYNINRSRCAKSVLSGDWAKEPPSLPLSVQEGFWKPLMETPSKMDLRSPVAKFEVCHDVARPVLVKEVQEVLKGMNDGSPGPDGIDRTTLRGVNANGLATHMNLWLCCGCSPTAFRDGITTLIPKSAESQQPGEYRPITVTTIVARLFHRILAKRCERHIPLSPRQKAFRRGDGLCDNIWLLRSTLQDRTRSRKPIWVTFIDVAKAFDSVSHQSMLIAARHVGVPDIVLGYVSSLYSSYDYGVNA